MAVNKSGLADRANGKRAGASGGPREKSTGARPRNDGNYKSRGTKNPVK